MQSVASMKVSGRCVCKRETYQERKQLTHENAVKQEIKKNGRDEGRISQQLPSVTTILRTKTNPIDGARASNISYLSCTIGDNMIAGKNRPPYGP